MTSLREIPTSEIPNSEFILKNFPNIESLPPLAPLTPRTIENIEIRESQRIKQINEERDFLDKSRSNIEKWVKESASDQKVVDLIQNYTNYLMHRYHAIENGKIWGCNITTYRKQFVLLINGDDDIIPKLEDLQMKIQADVVKNLTAPELWNYVENAWLLFQTIGERKDKLLRVS